MGAAARGPRVTMRLVRPFGMDGNPLRRASDRAEAWIRVGLLVGFLIAGPMAALAAGRWTAHVGDAGGAAQSHAAQAVLLRTARAPTGRAVAVRGAQVWVSARWESAGGSTRTGEVPAQAGAPAGTVVTVWLDASGRVTGPPQPGEFADEAVASALITLIAVALALLVVLRLIQRFLNWRHLAAWEAAWRAVGPRWTGRRL